jgi:hypothetical protein
MSPVVRGGREAVYTTASFTKVGGRKAENNCQSGETQQIYMSHGSWC